MGAKASAGGFFVVGFLVEGFVAEVGLVFVDANAVDEVFFFADDAHFAEEAGFGVAKPDEAFDDGADFVFLEGFFVLDFFEAFEGDVLVFAVDFGDLIGNVVFDATEGFVGDGDEGFFVGLFADFLDEFFVRWSEVD